MQKKIRRRFSRPKWVFGDPLYFFFHKSDNFSSRKKKQKFELRKKNLCASTENAKWSQNWKKIIQNRVLELEEDRYPSSETRLDSFFDTITIYFQFLRKSRNPTWNIIDFSLEPFHFKISKVRGQNRLKST